MQAHCLQHVPFEGMAAIEYWLVKNNFDVSYTRFYESLPVLPINKPDWLIVMGGPMSVNDDGDYEWLTEEKRFITECIQSGKVVIGVCLGAQLIATALGGKVYPNEHKEIGWFPVQKVKTASLLFDELPDELTVFHWHGETFDLPRDADLIAGSEACANQIFSIGNNVVGFQCHLETTSVSLGAIISNCRSELVDAKYIQSEKDMVFNESQYSGKMHTALFQILDKLLLLNFRKA